MMEVGLVKCFNCGRDRMRSREGKVIDGTWVDDWRVSGTEAWGKWVCSLNCYWEVINGYGWSYVMYCDEMCEQC